MCQNWFWTKEWQEMEQEADEDILLNRVEKFDSIDELISFLDERPEEE